MQPTRSKSPPGAEVDLKKFESYAQNGEDIRLHRCFGDQPTGLYIDIGSSEPTRHSVTYALYRAGWRGIAIEPLHDRWCELEAIRPRDTNLNIALAAEPGKAMLYRSLGRGGTSTIVSERGKSLQHHADVTEIEVEVDTLANICSAHLDGETTYELLKIDVEGAEDLVFAGADFGECRPLVIVAEGSSEAPGWETLLLENGYVFVTYDGLNRWFACSTRPDLANLLKTPTGSHDRYLNVDQYGSPFPNLLHPEHRWSATFGQAMIKAVRTLNPAMIAAAYLERVPQHMLDRPAQSKHYANAVRKIFGRRASEQELESFGMRQPSPTIKQLYEEIISSDEYLDHRGRAIASF
jgi:FkbM family methyltransferase